MYGKRKVRAPREITKAEWMIQQQSREESRLEEQAYEDNEEYEDDPDEEAEEVVRLPPKVVTPGGLKKTVKRVPRKR